LLDSLLQEMVLTQEHEKNSQHKLLSEAENWTPGQVEENSMLLLETATSVLTVSDSSPELKLDSLRWIASKLVSYVPVFELEDAILKLFFGSVLDYMEEAIKILEETTADTKVVFLSIIQSLLEYTEMVVRHCGEQQDCGVGEIPSLPRILPQILVKSFLFLRNSERIGSNSEIQTGVNQCFSMSKRLFGLFLEIFEEIKVRTVLQDELDILVKLCEDLVNFHDVLIPLDFKMTCMAWKLYLKLTSKYQAKLFDKLDFSKATEKVSEELNKLYANLRHLLETSTEDNNINKDVTKVAYLLKVVQTAAAQDIGKSKSFIRLLEHVFLELPEPPSWVPDVAKKKLKTDIMSPSIGSTLIKLASKEPFLSYLLSLLPELRKRNVKVALKISLELLMMNLFEHQDVLFDSCLQGISSGGCCLENPAVDGRQVKGKGVVKVDYYSWVLSNLCSFVSTLTAEEFIMIEKILFIQLLSPSSSVLSLMMVSDIFCFIARLSSSDLCLSHVKLITTLVESETLPNINLTVIQVLRKRLENFLSDSDKSKVSTSKIPSKDEVLRKWKLLKSGNYIPSIKFSSIKNVSDLAQHTRLKEFSVSEMGEIVECMMTLQERNTNNEDTLLFLQQVIGVVKAFTLKRFPINQQLLDTLVSMLKNKSGTTIAASYLTSIVKSQNFSAPNDLVTITTPVSSLEVSQLLCGCCSWKENYENDIFELISLRVGKKVCLEKQESCDKIKNQSENLSIGKKRKYSGSIEIESSTKRMEKEINFLLSQDIAALAEFKPRFSSISEKFQLIFQKIS